MAYDGILMSGLVNELKEKLVGGRIDKIHQPEADALVIHVKAPGLKSKLYISANSNLPHMTLIDRKMDNPLKAPMFCMLLRKHLSGGRILDIRQHELERVVHIDVEARNELGDLTSKQILVEIMGKHSNIILIDSNENLILDSIKRIPFSISRIRQILPGLKYDYLPTDKENLYTSSKEDFLLRIEKTPKSTQVFKWIYMNYQGFSPAASRAICFDADIEESVDITALTPKEQLALWTAMDKLKATLINKTYTPVIIKELSTGKYVEIAIFHFKEK